MRRSPCRRRDTVGRHFSPRPRPNGFTLLLSRASCRFDRTEALRAQFDAFGDLDDRVGNIERARQLLPEMERLRGALSGGPARLRLDRRIDALQRIVMLGAGISVTAQLSHDRLGTGSRGILYLRVNREGSTAPRRVRAELMGRGAEGRDGQVRLAFGPLANVPAGDVKPGWFRPTISFDVDGVSVTRQIPVQYTPVQRVALRWQRDVRMVPSSRSGGQIEVPIEIAWNGDQAVDASLEFEPADGVAAEVAEASIRLFAGGRKREEIVSVRLPDRPLNHDAKIYAVASVAGSRSKGGDQDPVAVGTSSLLVRPVDANLPEGLEVGLIRGPDDSLQLALQDLGIKYALLADDKPLGELNLSSMSTIVLDIRAYHHRRDYLRDNRDAILGYCKSGGRVVSFYHKPLEWNPTQVRPLLSPFELSVGRGRVCEEDAKVTFLESEHRLLNYPNKVGQEDFKGWVQERGLNFPNKWSSRWTPILRMNDTGERPLDGALLYAEYGEGDYVYCSLALYRQLRRGHAGAARILVNLLSK